MKTIWKAGNVLGPLPVVLVSVGDFKGIRNVLTIAWAGTIASDPPMVSISVRKERYSYELLCKHKNFVINLTTKDLAFATDWCGVKSGRDFDKFKEMKLTPLAAAKVSAPLIKESPINIECIVKDILHYGSHDMFCAEVVCVHADKKYISANGAFDFIKTKPIAFLKGKYFELGKFVGGFGFSVKKKKKG
ncbi:MAG: flavin reductase family protein [Elusimicrobiota bacterium]|jgi:flavin reductase (DIM6/NTAB) family NADH-FMN oxidoreductase RutF|nr:flavin reductase family protein [Elusimicrobiota bacterium]